MTTTRTTTVTLYSFDELSDDAQETALQAIAEREADALQYETTELEQVILYGIADALHSPGWDHYGEGDFPGIVGFRIDAWDHYRQYVEASGSLTRETAPNLPWSKFGAYHFPRQETGWANSFSAHATLLEGTEPYDDGTDYCVPDDNDHDYNELEEAISEAIHAGWEALDNEISFRTGEEAGREIADEMGDAFTESGQIA